MKFWGWLRRGSRPNPDVDPASKTPAFTHSPFGTPVLGDRERWLELLLAWTGRRRPLEGRQLRELNELEARWLLATPTHWVAFDEAIRSMDGYRCLVDWPSLELASRRAVDPVHGSLLAILSMAPEGRIRERVALRLGGVRGSPVALIALIQRANDWVPQVRSAAREALLSSVESGELDAWVIALSHLLRLEGTQRSQRDDAGAWFHLLLDRLRDHGFASKGSEVLAANVPDERRGLVAALLRHRLIEVEGVESCLHDPDLGIRVAAAAGLRSLESAADRRRLADLALEDRSHFVRLHALRIRIDEDPDAARDVLTRELGSTNRGLRRFARHHLGSEGADLADLVRRRVEAEPDQVGRGWIAALGELGGPGDRALLAPLRHRGARSRRAMAWEAWSSLDPEGSRDELHDALDPGEPRINKTLMAALNRTQEGPCPDRILAHLRSDRWTQREARVLTRGLERLSDWDRAACELMVSEVEESDGEPAVRRSANDCFARLEVAPWRKPSPKEARRLVDVVDALGHVPPVAAPLIERARAVVDS